MLLLVRLAGNWVDCPCWQARTRHGCCTQLSPVLPGTDTEKPGWYNRWEEKVVGAKKKKKLAALFQEAAAEWHNEGTTPL